jgi:hypothetical protein
MDDGTDGWMESFTTAFNICNRFIQIHYTCVGLNFIHMNFFITN